MHNKTKSLISLLFLTLLVQGSAQGLLLTENISTHTEQTKTEDKNLRVDYKLYDEKGNECGVGHYKSSEDQVELELKIKKNFLIFNIGPHYKLVSNSKQETYKEDGKIFGLEDKKGKLDIIEYINNIINNGPSFELEKITYSDSVFVNKRIKEIQFSEELSDYWKIGAEGILGGNIEKIVFCMPVGKKIPEKIEIKHEKGNYTAKKNEKR